MKTTALAPWFGSNRTRAAIPGKLAGKSSLVLVPFVGGGPELPYFDTRVGLANDLHRHIINLYRVVQNPVLCAKLQQVLKDELFHPDRLTKAQTLCGTHVDDTEAILPDVKWAAAYYVCVWMTRGGQAGTAHEFKQKLSVRYTSSGGSSVRRFRSAVESLQLWADALRMWEFTCHDGLKCIRKMDDRDGHTIYADPPWPKLGDSYAHTAPEFHLDLYAELKRFKHAKVIVRYGDDPIVRSRYSNPKKWKILTLTTKNQAGNAVPELYICNFKPNI